MNDDTDRLLATLAQRPPASERVITDVATKAGFDLPEDYVAFMRRSDGAEGPLPGTYLALWPLESLPERNEMYAVDEFAPGLFIFGSDGGDTAYAFVRRSDETVIVEVPFIGMSSESVRPLGSSFHDFIKAITADGEQ